jgi:hypothetical protein
MPAFERRTLTRTDLLVVAATLLLFAMLLAPSLAQQVGDARRESCANNCKMQVIALHNYEATHLFFPTASTAPMTEPPGNDTAEGLPGYSWQAQILPFMEQVPLYNAISENSQKFSLPPLGIAGREAGQGPLAATVQINEFLCPAFAGVAAVDVDASDYKSDEARGGAPARTSYFALSATHLVEEDGAWRLVGPPIALFHGNGVMPLWNPAEFDKLPADAAPKWRRLRGVTFAGIQNGDGTSNTLVFCESREQAYAAWIDGQVAWTVAAWPQNPQPPGELALNGPDAPKVLGWDEAGLSENGVTIAKQPHGLAADDAGVYLPEAMWSGSKDRKFGPSGNHPGVAAHAFADGHVNFLADNIDANVYLWLTTRAGREVVGEY